MFGKFVGGIWDVFWQMLSTFVNENMPGLRLSFFCSSSASIASCMSIAISPSSISVSFMLTIFVHSACLYGHWATYSLSDGSLHVGFHLFFFHSCSITRPIIFSLLFNFRCLMLHIHDSRVGATSSTVTSLSHSSFFTPFCSASLPSRLCPTQTGQRPPRSIQPCH